MIRQSKHTENYYTNQMGYTYAHAYYDNMIFSKMSGTCLFIFGIQFVENNIN
jgi:hypothetical protein